MCPAPASAPSGPTPKFPDDVLPLLKGIYGQLQTASAESKEMEARVRALEAKTKIRELIDTFESGNADTNFAETALSIARLFDAFSHESPVIDERLRNYVFSLGV